MPRTPRLPLPSGLETGFTVAQGLSAGLGQGRMRGRDLARPFHGVRIGPAALAAPSNPGSAGRTVRDPALAARCSALLTGLPAR